MKLTTSNQHYSFWQKLYQKFALQLAFQMFFYKLTKNQKFDIAIMVVILLNMTSMALEYYDAPDEFENALAYVNTVFITIFTLECIMKLLGIRFHYFKEPWNIFDFIVVIISLLSEWKYLCKQT